MPAIVTRCFRRIHVYCGDTFRDAEMKATAHRRQRRMARQLAHRMARDPELDTDFRHRPLTSWDVI